MILSLLQSQYLYIINRVTTCCVSFGTFSDTDTYNYSQRHASGISANYTLRQSAPHPANGVVRHDRWREVCWRNTSLPRYRMQRSLCTDAGRAKSHCRSDLSLSLPEWNLAMCARRRNLPTKRNRNTLYSSWEANASSHRYHSPDLIH